MISCQTCKDTKRHLVYSDTKGRIISEEEYKRLFQKSDAAFKILSDKITGGDDNLLKYMDHFANVDKNLPEYISWKREWRLEQDAAANWAAKLEQCLCVKDEMEAYYQKSRSEAVTGAVFSRLAKEGKIHPDIVEIAKEESMKSFLVIGPTGRGKTPLLMLNYNRLIKKRKSTDGIIFVTESRIRDIMDHDENFESWLKQLNGVDFLFIDEMFRNEVWKDLGDGTERDKSNRAARNMWAFLDYIYQRGNTIVVQGAGNKSPDETLPGLKNDAAAEYWRRINETFKEIKRVG
ncbi:ATP-binding protein [Leptospira johnsonii]|uniref:Uncharacterized protein n=1 Tax=Leptospira johnsonii TaxID=1917820 RepID=A0A2P2D7P1_9LEPT|nr:ATP-binding protein [Leptospira johnsonii]GBF40649.1 hypothetical protein LPTSP1_36670 [Leptospira johnsonii]